uniref:Nup88 domain-containing protein n=1 Tax=Meloidogyne hapla TaxID=6305 RepID=A0A1I8AZQ0_MELHA
MNFLRLFPPDYRQSRLIFCNYRQLGLFCWASDEPNKIVMVSALLSSDETIGSEKASENTPGVLFKRVLTVFLSPELPVEAEFTQILVNKTGNLLALVGKCMVFIVELDPDLWDYRRQIGTSLDFDSSIEHLKSEYYARLYDVNTVINRPYSVLDFNTLLADRTPSESGEEFNDNNSGVDSQPHSTFGFVTQIVSFDFGPVFPIAGNKSNNTSKSSSLVSVLALDMNGGIYIAFFQFHNSNNSSFLTSLTPIGPLTCIFPMVGPQSPPISSRLLCSSIDLHCIRHSQSQLIPLFAIASEDGFLAHLLLSYNVTELDQNLFKIEQITSEGFFNLFAFEFMQISSDDKISKTGAKNLKKKASTLSKASSIQLRHDPFELHSSSSCSYFLICSCDLFRLDLSSVLVHLIENCADHFKNKSVAPLPQSTIHQLLSFDDNGIISSIASLELLCPSLSNKFSLLDINHPIKNYKSQYQLLAALCTSEYKLNENGTVKTKFSHHFLATLFNRCFKSSQLTNNSPLTSVHQQKSSTSSQLSAEIRRQLSEGFGTDNLASTLPSINLDNEQTFSQRISALSLMQNAIQNIFLNKAMPVREKAFNYTLKRAENILSISSEVVRLRENIQQRLMDLFRQINDIKALILKRQHQYRMLDERIQKIAQILQPVMFSSSEDEIETLDKLQIMQKRIFECRREIQTLNSRINESRQNLFVSNTDTKTATTSTNELIPAQMFILSKNERQCNKLREQIIFLENKID